jgi:hypothetical protein
VTRGGDGVIDDSEYADPRTDLRAEIDAGEAAVEAAARDVERSGVQGPDVQDVAFAQMAQLHAVVIRD